MTESREAPDMESGFGVAPENRLDYEPHDIYRKLTRKERQTMQEKIEQNTVKFAAALDEEILPTMPKTKRATVLAKRRFLGIIAERQARLQAQIEWLHAEQEKNRKLQEDL